jgi:uncharacterized membrane protein (UPF0182 family)
MISNIPPESQVDEIKITRPEIYFGELTNNYVIVNTSEDEFDYPDGSTNKYTKYEGDAGIKMNFINKCMFALRQQSLKMLVSSNIDSKSKILIRRNIHERVHKVMPYLSYDEDPYMITDNGKLYWIIDAYTTTNMYPYSEPYSNESDVNYIRNSVKVVIDAYNGTTDYYIVDEEDPIAQNYYLEVSSPGMDRILYKEKDFAKFQGKLVDVSLYKAFEGKKAYEGILVGLVDGHVVITDEKDNELKFPAEQVSKTRLAVVF